APLEVRLGQGGLLEGVNIGLAGMRVGGKRQLVLPPELGYGRMGRPPTIPPNATLVFDLEMVAAGDIRVRPEQPDVHFDSNLRTQNLGPGVRAVDLQFGAGPLIQERSVVRVEATLWRTSGELIVSTFDVREARPFLLGSASTHMLQMAGLKVGVLGMAAGGSRYLELTSDATLGSHGQASIGPPGERVFALVDVIEVSEPRIAPDAPSYYDPAMLKTTESGLQMLDLEVGTGARVRAKDVVIVEYTGWLSDGTRFDSTYERAVPFRFQHGRGRTIAAWEEGVTGMQVGGRRILIASPDLAYRDRQTGKIPAGSTLTFEIEVKAIESSEAE
ncbi:MAG: FKBP-type peptidyl-prolyl cis-trans isomerase, partial [Myxococcota bacterium]